ncbi:MAG TPA: transposase, partial [Pyrinomonadaceae bacterium]|nr:transposase [Pyrinomonadaceae bacterium]
GVKARVLYLQQYQLLPYSRTSEAMRELFGCPISSGTVAHIVKECAAALVETELKIKQKLRRSGVIHADETGLRVAKQGHYIHVSSNCALTHYGYDSRRGRAAMDEIGILPKYRGNLVHDGWWSYDYYTNCQHSLCCAHLLRELTFFAELNAGRSPGPSLSKSCCSRSRVRSSGRARLEVNTWRMKSRPR